METSFYFYLLNGIFMLALPTGLGFVLTRRFKLGWRIWWIGAGTFVLSQAGHLRFNALATALFSRGVLPLPPPEGRLVFNVVFLGLSSGLWEETARYAAFRWWAKDARSWRKAVLLGAGHGGIEAILLGVLVLVNLIILISLRGRDLANVVPAEQLELAAQQVQAYWSAPWNLILLGALERAFAIPMHLALSVIVWQTIARRQIWWLAVAILWHALANALAVYTAALWGPYASEALLAVNALACLGVISALHQPKPVEAEPVIEPLPPALDLAHLEIQDTEEGLERSRYHGNDT